MNSNLPTTKTSGRGGRPQLSPDDKRKAYGVRLSARERAEATQHAADQNMEFGVYCRMAVLQRASPRPVPRLNLEVWHRLSGLADAIESLASDGRHDRAGDDRVLAKLEELDGLLRSTRLALLGIHDVPDNPA